MKRIASFSYRLIGPAVFAGLLWFTDLSHVGEIWSRGRTWPLVGAAALNAVIILVKGWRWRRLMRTQGIDYGYGPAVRYYAISCAAGAWTPGRLGDFTKALAVQRDCAVGLGRAASSVIADRLCDAVALGAVATVGVAFMPWPWSPYLAGGGLVAVGIGIWIIFHKTKRHPSTRAAQRGAERVVGALGTGKTMRTLGAAREEVGAAIDGLVTLSRPDRGQATVATVIATLVTFTQGYLVAISLGLDVGFWSLAVALSVVSIASLLPVSVAGLGTREASLALFLKPAGISMPQIISFSLAYFIVISGSVALMGALAWVIKPESHVRVVT